MDAGTEEGQSRRSLPEAIIETSSDPDQNPRCGALITSTFTTPVIDREPSAAADATSIALMPRATWNWTFDLPPSELWPVLADTNRFNEAMGLPPYALRGDAAAQRHGAAPRQGQGGGLHPGMGGEALRVDRGPAFPLGPRVRQGPVPPLRAGVRPQADGKGGSVASYALEV